MRTSALAKRLAIATGAASLVALSSTMTIANAQLNTSNFDVTTTWAEQCIVNSGGVSGLFNPTVIQVPVDDVDFGLIEAEDLPTLGIYTASTSFDVQCTLGTSYDIELSSGGNTSTSPILFGFGWTFSGQMSDGNGHIIPYTLGGLQSLVNRTGNGLTNPAQTIGVAAAFDLAAALNAWGSSEPAGGAVFTDTVLITVTVN